MDDKEDKLTNLELGDEGFPGAGDVVGGEEVVGVHEDMDEGVVSGGKVGITLGEIIQVQPPNEEDREVVVKMEDGDLVVLLSQGHDDGIHEFVNFGNIEDPDQRGHGGVGFNRDFVVAEEGVLVLDGFIDDANGHVTAQDHKEGVVEDTEVEEVVGLPVFHKLHQGIDNNQVENRDDQSITNISKGPITRDLTGRVLVTPDSPHGVGLLRPVKQESVHFLQTARFFLEKKKKEKKEEAHSGFFLRHHMTQQKPPKSKFLHFFFLEVRIRYRYLTDSQIALFFFCVWENFVVKVS